MAERRIGLIPRVLQAGGNDAYSVLVTDKRLLFVPEKASEPGIRVLLRELFFDEESAPELGPVDFRTCDLDDLAARKGSVSIRVVSVGKAMVERFLGGIILAVEETGDDGKTLSHMFILDPTPELVKANKNAGISARETKRRYALKCQKLVRLVLPPMVVSEGKWLD